MHAVSYEDEIHELPPPSTTFSSSPSMAKRRPQPQRIHTPSSPLTTNIPHNMLPSAPASPPTPAPSPTPGQRIPDWSTAGEDEDVNVRDIRVLFAGMNDAEQQRLLAELLNLCNSQQLAFVQDFVSPRLKKDPFTTFPDELCLRVRLNTVETIHIISNEWS
jgi:F-box and WD-40 domain protein CDC4